MAARDNGTKRLIKYLSKDYVYVCSFFKKDTAYCTLHKAYKRNYNSRKEYKKSEVHRERERKGARTVRRDKLEEGKRDKLEERGSKISKRKGERERERSR